MKTVSTLLAASSLALTSFAASAEQTNQFGSFQHPAHPVPGFAAMPTMPTIPTMPAMPQFQIPAVPNQPQTAMVLPQEPRFVAQMQEQMRADQAAIEKQIRQQDADTRATLQQVSVSAPESMTPPYITTDSDFDQVDAEFAKRMDEFKAQMDAARKSADERFASISKTM